MCNTCRGKSRGCWKGGAVKVSDAGKSSEVGGGCMAFALALAIVGRGW